MATAKHRAIDQLRRNKLLERKHEELGRELEPNRTRRAPDIDAALDDDIGDDLLRLMFTACHPVLSTEARVALTLRLLGGLTTDEIARAFLVPEPTIAQRIVRAKRTLAEAQRAVRGAARRRAAPNASSSVLEVIYLIFNEGYSATAGDDWMRPALCEEALRLGRILAGLAPDEPEVHGLVALMEIQASRSRARIGPTGEPILLLDQNRARWDQLLIRRGLAALERAEALGAARGPYTLQAAIAACHARARTARRDRLAAHRRALRRARAAHAVTGRRAEPRGRASRWRSGPRPGCELVDHADARAGARTTTTCCRACAATCWRSSAGCDEARAEFERAASLTRNARERELLLARAASGPKP